MLRKTLLLRKMTPLFFILLTCIIVDFCLFWLTKNGMSLLEAWIFSAIGSFVSVCFILLIFDRIKKREYENDKYINRKGV